MTPVLAFDIETIPDIAGLRLLHGLPDTDVSDADVAEYAFQRQRYQGNNNQRVVYNRCKHRALGGVQPQDI